MLATHSPKLDQTTDEHFCFAFFEHITISWLLVTFETMPCPALPCPSFIMTQYTRQLLPSILRHFHSCVVFFKWLWCCRALYRFFLFNLIIIDMVSTPTRTPLPSLASLSILLICPNMMSFYYFDSVIRCSTLACYFPSCADLLLLLTFPAFYINWMFI